MVHVEEDYEEDNDDTGTNREENSVVNQVMERVQIEQENTVVVDNEEGEREDSTTQEATANNNVSVWFDKLEPFINHFRDVNENMIFTLGTKLSLDEMMIRFEGRSKETHRIKNKPIGEGYKFFVLATSSGFVVNFTPDGRTAAKNNQ